LTVLPLIFILIFAPQADFQARFVNGLKALNERDLPQARANLIAASKLQPENPRVQVALAQTYWRLNEPAPAAAAALKAERLGASDPLTLRTLAVYYAEQKKLAKAGDIELMCAAIDAQDKAAITRAMTDYLQAGEPKKAIDAGLSAKDRQDRADLRNLLGKAYEADGQFVKTLPELQAAIRLKPDDESYYFDLTQVLLSHFNFEAAIRVGEEARRRFPGSAQAALAVGVAYYGQNRQPAAIQAFLDAIDLDPAHEQPYFFLARLLNQANEKLPAIGKKFSDYERANPASYLGYFLHAKLLLAGSGDPEQTEELLRKSVALDGAYWESHYLLGVVLTNRHAYAEAEKQFRRSVELNPKDPAIHYRLFRTLAALGRTREAEAELVLQRKISAEYQADLDRSTGEIKRLDLSR
jgi:tetratricopeptide (TPR) repeat protein